MCTAWPLSLQGRQRQTRWVQAPRCSAHCLQVQLPAPHGSGTAATQDTLTVGLEAEGAAPPLVWQGGKPHQATLVSSEEAPEHLRLVP